MKKKDFHKLVDEALSGTNFNTTFKVRQLRTMLMAALKMGDYPHLSSLEKVWRSIENSNTKNGPDRESYLPMTNPMLIFNFYVKYGFYPPPEVMLAVSLCFNQYINAGGGVSLDEAFFNRPHQIRSSFSFLHQQSRGVYAIFNLFWAGPDNFVVDKKLKGQPLEKRAELYLDHLLEDNEFDVPEDVESFLRGYRRWKNRIAKEGFQNI